MNYETLPIVLEEWQYEVKTKTKTQYNVLKRLMNDNSISTVICGTEEGRKRTLWLEGDGSLFFRQVEFIALHFCQN